MSFFKMSFFKIVVYILYMDLPNITIDNINFSLVGYNPPNDVIDRPALKIISKMPDGITFDLYLYQSETSLGFWRLGCNNRGTLYKGENDYIQQSFIHFTLQEFINKNISKIIDNQFINRHPELDETTKAYIEKDTPDILSSNFPFCCRKLKRYKCTLDYYIAKIIDDPSRMINISTFFDLDKIVDNRCGNWKSNPASYLQSISDNLSNDYKLVKASVRFLYNSMYKYKDNNYDGTPIKLNIIYNIFICNLQSNTSEPDLYLYYTIYKIIDVDKIEKDKILVDDYYFPLFLTTSKEITPFGVYKNYVLSAGYICKLFEYKHQSRGFGSHISKEHNYIGLMYNNLFPFNEIKLI